MNFDHAPATDPIAARGEAPHAGRASLRRAVEVLRLERAKNAALLAAVVFVVLGRFTPAPGTLPPRAQAVFGVLAAFIVLAVTGAVEKIAVGLLTPTALVLAAGYRPAEAFRSFSSGAFLLGVGTFVFAGVLMATPLGRRIALGIVGAVRSSEVTKIMLGLAGADVAVGGALPAISETALFLPIVTAINALVRQKGDTDEARRMQTALLYMDPGLVPLFTGPLILTSHFPNLMLAEHLETNEHLHVGFADWLWLNLPLWGLLPILYFYVRWFFRLRGLRIPGIERALPELRRELGPVTGREIWAAGSIAFGVLLWMTEGRLHHVRPEIVALIVVGLLFAPWSGIRYRDVAPHVLWETLFLLGGAIALGDALSSSGAVSWMIDGISRPLRQLHLPTLLLVGVVVFGLHLVRAGLTSNVAMGAAFIPVVAALAKALGLAVLPFTILVIGSMTYAFLLPVSGTAFLVAWGASRSSGWEVVKFGVPLHVICNLYIVLVQTGWLAWIGYPLR